MQLAPIGPDPEFFEILEAMPIEPVSWNQPILKIGNFEINLDSWIPLQETSIAKYLEFNNIHQVSKLNCLVAPSSSGHTLLHFIPKDLKTQILDYLQANADKINYIFLQGIFLKLNSSWEIGRKKIDIYKSVFTGSNFMIKLGGDILDYNCLLNKLEIKKTKKIFFYLE